MRNIGAGIGIILVTAVASLYGVAEAANHRDGKVPFLGFEMHGLAYAFLMLCWLVGGIERIARGVGQVVTRRSLAAQLQKGVPPLKLFLRRVDATVWTKPFGKELADGVLAGKAYPDLVRRACGRGRDFADVVLFYKLLIGNLNEQAEQIRDACRVVGIPADELPTFSFPAAKVVAQGGFFSKFKNDDLLVGYDGGLVTSADELA
jgi:hypothetical protein